MAISEKRRIISTVIAVSLLGVLTGLFLGGDLLPSQAAQQMYDEKATTTREVTTAVDGEGEYTKTVVVTTTETTPHGYTHDFAATIAIALGIIPPPIVTTPGTTQTAANTTQTNTDATQTAANITQTSTDATLTTANTTQTTPTPTKVYQVWLFYNDVMPPSITVPVGATVTWTNMDNMEHTVNFDNLDFDVRLVARGTTASYTFNEAGKFTYACDPHPSLKGDVIVK